MASPDPASLGRPLWRSWTYRLAFGLYALSFALPSFEQGSLLGLAPPRPFYGVECAWLCCIMLSYQGDDVGNTLLPMMALLGLGANLAVLIGLGFAFGRPSQASRWGAGLLLAVAVPGVGLWLQFLPYLLVGYYLWAVAVVTLLLLGLLARPAAVGT